MATKLRRLAAVISLIAMTALMAGCSDKIVVLNPKGEVGKQQLDLILITTGLCLIVIVPVLIMTFVFAWRYRQKSKSKTEYAPEWEHNNKLEATWWTIPIIIITIIGVVTVIYTYKLEPSKPLEHEAEPVVIQVTSLDWKWLFQYPEQDIATVNYVKFPADRPVRFELTSDAPMNSFWIPQLGGQIYTMSGMAMKLHLIADEPGEYLGMGANFSGKDFAKMQFMAHAVSQEEFDAWVKDVKRSTPELTEAGYENLAKPGVIDGTMEFSDIPEGLFDRIVTKYGAHEGHSGHEDMEETEASVNDADVDEAAETTSAGTASSSSHHH